MAYQKNNWVDQNVERPKTYELTNNADGSVTLIDSFGLVSALGTPVNADNMNHIEEGIEEHEKRITSLESKEPGANKDLSNLSEAGKEAISNYAAPSGTLISFSTSTREFIAPASGTVWVGGGFPQANAYVIISNYGQDGTGHKLRTQTWGGIGNLGFNACLPCKQGDHMEIGNYGTVNYTDIKLNVDEGANHD